MSFLTALKSVAKDLLPPVVVRALGHLKKKEPPAPPPPDPQALAREAFYRRLLPENALCFDIGANVGNRTSAFRRCGFRVVALEPQPQCYSQLRLTFGDDAEVKLVNKAAGSAPDQATMMISDMDDRISSMSRAFVEATADSKRFGNATWKESITVEVVTLDQLIAEYGVPDFIKVDVEGFELEVVRGLSRPIGLISLEWVPELTDRLIDCLNHLAKLGPITCNLSWGESMRFSRSQWMNQEKLIFILNEFREDNLLFGDVYVRSTNTA